MNKLRERVFKKKDELRSMNLKNPDSDLVRGGSLNEEDPLVKNMNIIGNAKYTRNANLKLYVGDKV